MFPDRTKASIRSKVRKLRISNDLFGNSYRNEKSCFTDEVGREVSPITVFEGYAGAGHQSIIWLNHCENLFASEKNATKWQQFYKNATKEGFQVQVSTINNWLLFTKGSKKIYFYKGDVIDAAAEIRTNKLQIDLIDLDTCGSTLPSLGTILTLIKPKHLLITHGEFHSMRFKREDVLRRVFSHRDIDKSPFPLTVDQMSSELDKAVKINALRAHNETQDSYWLELKKETWLGSKFHGMLRRYYSISKPPATADCLNELSNF